MDTNCHLTKYVSNSTVRNIETGTTVMKTIFVTTWGSAWNKFQVHPRPPTVKAVISVHDHGFSHARLLATLIAIKRFVYKVVPDSIVTTRSLPHCKFPARPELI